MEWSAKMMMLLSRIVDAGGVSLLIGTRVFKDECGKII